MLPAIFVGQLNDLAVELDFPDDSMLLPRKTVDSAKAFYVSFLPLEVFNIIIKHVLGADLVPELIELRNSQWLDLAPDGKWGGTRANWIWTEHFIDLLFKRSFGNGLCIFRLLLPHQDIAWVDRLQIKLFGHKRLSYFGWKSVSLVHNFAEHWYSLDVQRRLSRSLKFHGTKTRYLLLKVLNCLVLLTHLLPQWVYLRLGIAFHLCLDIILMPRKFVVLCDGYVFFRKDFSQQTSL